MSIFYNTGDPEKCLHMKSLPFEVAYAQTFSPLISTLQEQSISKTKVEQIASNIFEHPSLNLASIFDGVRNSDYQISKDDASTLKTFLEECKNDVQTMNAKAKQTILAIAKLSRDLAETSARMVQKLSQVKLCEYIISPPHHLPQDILEGIFSACLQSVDGPEPHPNRAPLQLAAVNHRWRSIALSMPILWNNLLISSSRSLELAMIWVKRCYLPSFTLNFDGTQRISVERLNEFLITLDNPSLQIRRLDIRISGADVRTAMENFILNRDHPMLEELALREDYTRFPKLPSSPIKRLYSYSKPKSWDDSLPPPQLTVLWLTVEIHWTLLEAFLAQCPNLESLYVSLSEAGARPPAGSETVLSKDLISQHLTYFGISNDCKSENPPEDLLRGVVFPTLKVVEYCVTKRGIVALPWLVFNPSLGHIRRLTIQFDDSCEFSQDTFLRIIQPATALEELAIGCARTAFSDVLSVLASLPTSPLGEQSILPNLKRLYLALEGSLNRWSLLDTQLSTLSQAWSSPPSIPTRTHYILNQLTILYRFEKDSEVPKRNEDALEVRKMLQAVCPNLPTRIISYRTISWFWDVPTMFGMHPQPFNKIKPYEVFNDGDSWTQKVASFYSVN